MNERIQELWRQAVLNNTKTPMNFQDAANEFADLIVWECMKICEDVMKKDNSALACWSAIKGTFRS